MPRRGRLHIPGGCYHLIGRGLERRYIFADAADKRDFLSRLGRCLARYQAQCLAWAIMSNHYHLLLRAGTQPLSSLMASLLGGYAGCYNRRHNRVGYVFQNRFKSILCEEDRYLLELVRYIHLNPVRAGMVSELKQLERYPWTGHAGIVSKNPHDWYATDEVLRFFGDTRKKARSAYRNFVKAGLSIPNNGRYSGGGLIRSNGGWESVGLMRAEHSRSIGDERILGSGGFVEQALSDDELRVDRKTRRRQQGWTLDELVRCVCNAYEVDESSLTVKARMNNLAIAKSLICFWGFEELGLTLVEIGARLQIRQQSVSPWVQKGRIYSQSKNLTLDGLVR